MLQNTFIGRLSPAVFAILFPLIGNAQQATEALQPPATSEQPTSSTSEEQQKFPVVALATLGDSESHITSGLVWRVYQSVDENVSPALVTKSQEASPIIYLPSGEYILQATYGYASTSKKINVEDRALTETLIVNAGALKLSGTVGDTPIPSPLISFSVYVSIGTDTEGKLILSNAKPGDTIRLPAGTYHIVSTYGDANAIQRADLKVETGKVTEAVLNHRAAVVTLKLVATEGSEAFADTAFSVLTPGGDVVREAIGAFPQVTLAEGDYVLIARHDNKVYSREFKVEAGLNRDIEVIETKDRAGDSTPN
ncbi:hypothetical protein WJT86_10660 [Microvirga sp. W0021]|uniref:Uncharacterized protein n=1 Tax=Hohaiivirga grylli TaxID=3133970 RepID=A0ABV0BLF0_9HYPH